MSDAPGLLALQRVDSELDQLAARRKRLPELAAVAEARADLQRWTAASDEQHAVTDRALAAIEAAEGEGVALHAKQARLEAQLKTIIAPREAEALMHEIDAVKAKHRDLDDVELEAMDQQAGADARLAELAAEEPAVRGRLAEAQATLAAAEAALAAQEFEVAERRTAAAEQLDADDRALYDAVRRQHGAVGFCTLDRHTCTGCHVDLSQVEFERAIAESKVGLAECPHCARVLVI